MLNSSDLCPRWTDIHRWPELEHQSSPLKLRKKQSRAETITPFNFHGLFIRGRFTFVKTNFLRHLSRMTVAQMSINFHRQRAAILVAEPATDGWYINAGFNATRGEQVAQIVMRDAGDAQFFTGRINRTLTFVNEHDWLA